MAPAPIKPLRLVMLVVSELHKRGFHSIRLHSYIKGGLGALRVWIIASDKPFSVNGESSDRNVLELFSFSSFDRPDDGGFLTKKSVIAENDLDEIVDDFIRKHTKILEDSKKINNIRYVHWFSDLIKASEPDGFYIVEDQQIIYPPRAPVPFPREYGEKPYF